VSTAQEMLDYLESVREELAPGDGQFFLSLLWQHNNKKERGSSLSESQVFHLKRLVSKYSASALIDKRNFRDNYSDDHRLIALRCARYYDVQYPRYYGNIVDKVLNSPENHVLEYSEYNKMCNNKYAKKILAAYDEPKKFSVGQMAQIRANNRVDIANKNRDPGSYANRSARLGVRNKVCMILQVDALPITRAAKGARIYKVLVIDEASPIFAHESDLKKVRGLKK